MYSPRFISDSNSSYPLFSFCLYRLASTSPDGSLLLNECLFVNPVYSVTCPCSTGSQVTCTRTGCCRPGWELPSVPVPKNSS